ncbi:SDR family oxidoreductase [Bradyrhizobium prioriisuperbiae]|uniref:SDR family oxidoreductase n=1 Tax=Bradyrhizobium prioriisuperbiae TaxID=2854389 RepID=UPI0028EC0789|nr:SDR family oxidoreductase [Bradyrhizobium prioritasuperba]
MTTERKSIFITGAASGMGRETAKLFAGHGWFVGCYDVNDDGLTTLKDELGGNAGLFQRLDVCDRAAYLDTIAAFGRATGGRMDILFNNAGIGLGGFYDEMAWEDVLRIVNINLIGVLSGVHAAMPLLKATPNALCFSTSSASAIFGAARISVYSATKHAVKGFTEALSVELARLGIRCADVLPGWIDTPLVSQEMRDHLPAEGLWRLSPPSAVADAVWAAYHGDKVHYYVPSELHDLDKLVTAQPEQTRDQRRRLLAERMQIV